MTMVPGQRRAGKLGKLPARHDAIKLKFSHYLNRAKLPTLPSHFGHVTNLPPTSHGWGMLGNDVAGNCVIAGRAHEIMVHALATGRSVPPFAQGGVLADYSRCLVACGGKPYNPHDGSTDTGLDVQQAAKWWQKIGMTDANGRVHKIDAYVAIESVDDLLMATYICGAGGCGLAIPRSAETQFEAGQVWDDLKSKPVGGHYVPCVGFMGGHLVFVTWGQLQGATKEYVAARMEDGVCCLSREYIGANGLSPELIEWSSLLDDVDSISSGATTVASARQQVAAAAYDHAAEQEQTASEQEPEQAAEPAIEHPLEEPEEPEDSHPAPPKPRHKPQGDKPKRKPPRRTR